MGDGWCDFQNNRGYCGWDGGDCCVSTVRGGRVRLMFPSLCTSILCQCIDPFAAENMASNSDTISPSKYFFLIYLFHFIILVVTYKSIQEEY